MQRYFIHSDQIRPPNVTIEGNDAHHLIHVLRSREGDQIICTDGQGTDFLVTITQITPNQLLGQIIESFSTQSEPQIHVTVAHSLPKGDKLELVIQKCTEIGASRFVPFTSSRTVVKLEKGKGEKKRDRWSKIAKEAAEQAHRGRVPDVTSVLSWKELLTEIKKVEEVWIAYEKGGQSMRSRMADSTATSFMIIVGPEGGFTEQEVAEAVEAGAIPITLGPRILRTETAPILALSCMMYAKNELGGE